MPINLVPEAKGICKPSDFEEPIDEVLNDTSVDVQWQEDANADNDGAAEEKDLVEHWFQEPMVPWLYCFSFLFHLFISENFWRPG